MPESLIRVLIAEDSPADARLLIAELRRAGFNPDITQVQTESDFLDHLTRDPDIVLCDYNLPQFDAMRALELLRSQRPDVPFLIVSGSIGEETAVRAMKLGATDYLLKDRLGRLGSAVRQALDQRALQRAERAAQEALRFQKALLECQTEASPDGILVVDPNQQILSFNQRFLDVWGIPKQTVLNGNDGSLLAIAQTLAADSKLFMSRVEEINSQPDLESHEEVLLADGRTLDRISRPVRGPNGERYGRVWYFRDITERKRIEQSVRASEERFRAFMDNSPATSFIKDESGRYLYVNPTWLTQFDSPPRDWLGKSDFEIWPQETAEVFHASDVVCLTQNTVVQSEEAAHTKNGKEYFKQVMKFPLIEGGQRRIGGMAWDITDRKRAEQVRAERVRLMSLIGDVGLALNQGEPLKVMLRLCTEAIVRHLDAAFARIWTISDDETTLELQASAGLYTHLDGPHSRVPIGTFKIGLIAEERKPHLTNFVLDDPRIGDREWAKREGLVSFAGYPLLVGSRIVGVVAMFAKKPLGENAMQALSAIADQIALGIDRKWTEQELHLRDRAIGAATQGLIITDHEQPHNPIVYVSPGFVRITGYRPEECYGKNCNFLQGEDTDSVAIETIRTSIRDGRPCTVELINYRKDGRQFWNSLTLAPVYDGDRVTHYVGVQTDITERRKMEEQFRQVQKMEAIGQLAAGVAHDFNNLLTVINGYSEILLAEKSQNDADRVAISSIRNAGERAASLTAQLLAFSRKAVIEPKVFDLNDVVEHLAKMLRRLIGEDINFTSRLEPGLWKIKADPGQIEQVIMNLSVNARDAMPKGGIITIQTANIVIQPGSDFETRNFEPGPYVRLSVSDTGTGMTEEVKSKIFEPFFTTKGIGKGTGLGLATVFGIVEQAGGHIRVSTSIGKGTTFEVYLAAVADVATNSSEAAAATPVNGAETVLIVEDEDAVRMLLRMTLESNGYQVLIAASGPDAIELSDLYQGEIHLLVTDVIMPEMGGRELAENIRSRRKEINVLYVSGYTDDAVVRHGVISSAESFLQKPFTPLVLLRKVRSILDAKRK